MVAKHSVLTASDGALPPPCCFCQMLTAPRLGRTFARIHCYVHRLYLAVPNSRCNVTARLINLGGDALGTERAVLFGGSTDLIKRALALCKARVAVILFGGISKEERRKPILMW